MQFFLKLFLLIIHFLRLINKVKIEIVLFILWNSHHLVIISSWILSLRLSVNFLLISKIFRLFFSYRFFFPYIQYRISLIESVKIKGSLFFHNIIIIRMIKKYVTYCCFFIYLGKVVWQIVAFICWIHYLFIRFSKCWK